MTAPETARVPSTVAEHTIGAGLRHPCLTAAEVLRKNRGKGIEADDIGGIRMGRQEGVGAVAAHAFLIIAAGAIAPAFHVRHLAQQVALAVL